ncbi:hypothetical protein [Nocardia mangyaensis]|uniref:hypothetical protein n=1 Tax=Nocardia mangyaensis TaxID=2213200 RepID=UPI0026749CF5|nr:hypothetical protein [Nocardia mangyaensis]MDO3646913.1 hypothetical protein [Nocardia mangyaensis]
MRNTLRRKAMACCGLVAVAVVTVVGCGSDDEEASSPSTSSAVTTSAEAAAADPATVESITDAYLLFFDGKAPADQKVAMVEKGAEFTPLLEAQAANPQAQSTSVTVGGVKLIDADNADVTYSLLMNGAPVLPDQTGQAVREGGQWKVAAATYCALMAIQGGTSPAC